MHEVLVNRLGGLSLPRKSVVRLTDRPDMTLDVYRGRKTTKQQQQQIVYHTNRTQVNRANIQHIPAVKNRILREIRDVFFASEHLRTAKIPC